VATRKQLREVQHELAKDIDSLQARIEFVNIGGVPLLVLILAVGLGSWRAAPQEGLTPVRKGNFATLFVITAAVAFATAFAMHGRGDDADAATPTGPLFPGLAAAGQRRHRGDGQVGRRHVHDPP